MNYFYILIDLLFLLYIFKNGFLKKMLFSFIDDLYNSGGIKIL